VTVSVIVDIAGAQMGGAARYAAELYGYLARTGREDIQVIGAARRIGPGWLVRRELVNAKAARRVALNNISFVGPSSERWTLVANALHFLTDTEAAQLDASLRVSAMRQAAVIRLAARRSDVIIAPCSAMAERIVHAQPGLRHRVIVRAHPVSGDSIPQMSRDSAILCPVILAPYKHMDQRLTELLAAIKDCAVPSVRVRVTASAADLPPAIVNNPNIELIGRLDQRLLRLTWAKSRAIYFPTGLESFGYPLAEARASGHPVIARDTAQNREIAGSALCAYAPGNPDSLRHAVSFALTREVMPDPSPFLPDTYFDWLLGEKQ
jgi:glycosyltransferase involved in cell wall biosynthesis